MKIFVAGLRGFPRVPGGIETHCQQLYPRLVRRGCRVIVFTRRPYVDPTRRTFQGVRLIALDSPGNKYLETLIHSFRAVFVARRMGARILHLHAIGPGVAAPLARLLGMKVVVTHHGQDYLRQKWNLPAKLFLRVCETAAVLCANRVIAVSRPIVLEMCRAYGRKPAFVPNGVPDEARIESEASLIKFGLEKKKYVLAVGRLVPEKGFADLIDAFGTGREGYKLVLVGSGDPRDPYVKLLHSKASRNPDVILTGALSGDPLHELYHHAGLFVIPSYHEGLPIVLLEAKCAGVSCLASNIPANRTVHMHPDRYFETGDVAGLSQLITRYLEEPISVEESAAQVRRIRARYDWDRIADQTLVLYASLDPQPVIESEPS